MVNISFLLENIDEITSINDVLLPPIIHNHVRRYAKPYFPKLISNQEQFIVDYRYGEYTIDGESEKEEQNRLFDELFKKYPHLIHLIDDAADTFKESTDEINFEF